MKTPLATNVLALGFALIGTLVAPPTTAQAAEDSARQPSTHQPSKKPNILWILTDDQRPDSLTAFNHAVDGRLSSPLGHVASPNIDKLAEAGTLFTQAYCNSPGCVPSRSSMHTGKYTHHNGIYGFWQAHQETDFATPLLPEEMRALGYHTAYFGKIGVYIFEWQDGLTWNLPNYYDVRVDLKNDLTKKGKTDLHQESVWGKVNDKPGSIGRKEVYYFPDGRKEVIFRPVDGVVDGRSTITQAKIDAELDILRAHTRAQSTMIIGGQSPQPAGETVDGHIAKAFIQHLDRVESESIGQPLFAHLSFHFPHTPVLPPKSFRDQFKDKQYFIPEFTKDELNKLPPQLVALFQKMQTADLAEEEKQQAIRDYYAFCAYGDSLIGQSIDAFVAHSKKRGEPYAIVYVCGDHGWHLGEQGLESKFGPYEKSNRGAVIVAASPDSGLQTVFRPGDVVDRFVEYVDFAPTLIGLGGGDLADGKYQHLDGHNLTDVARGTSDRDYVLGEMNHVIGPRAYLRSKDFAFSMRNRPKNNRPGAGMAPNQDIQWALTGPREAVEMVLYDLRVDPAERFNVADHPAYAKLADALRIKLANITCGDGRVECDWKQQNAYDISNFAEGADDKKLDFPAELIPKPAKLDETWLLTDHQKH